MKMNTIELEKLKQLLEQLELESIGCYRKISGGFSNAEMYDFDDDHIYVELKYGVQSDCQDTVHKEHLKINRETMLVAE
jgi:hypothetical protein